jgi:hypothetical protein
MIGWIPTGVWPGRIGVLIMKKENSHASVLAETIPTLAEDELTSTGHRVVERRSLLK